MSRTGRSRSRRGQGDFDGPDRNLESPFRHSETGPGNVETAPRNWGTASRNVGATDRNLETTDRNSGSRSAIPKWQIQGSGRGVQGFGGRSGGFGRPAATSV